MKRIFLLLCICSCVSIYAQTLKTYSGSFKGGSAVYSYYVSNNDERVYNGPFSFKGDKVLNIKNDVEGIFSINGSFKNDLRDGEWIFTCVSETKDGQIRKKELKINYKNGQRNGVCEYKDVIDSRTIEHIVFSCVNDYIVGQIKYTNSKEEINGQIQNGNPVGTWVKQTERIEYSVYDGNGIFAKSNYYVDEETGKKKDIIYSEGEAYMSFLSETAFYFALRYETWKSAISEHMVIGEHGLKSPYIKNKGPHEHLFNMYK